MFNIKDEHGVEKMYCGYRYKVTNTAIEQDGIVEHYLAQNEDDAIKTLYIFINYMMEVLHCLLVVLFIAVIVGRL